MSKKTSSQKAIVALEIEERLAKEARARRLAGLKQNQRAESLRNELCNGSETSSHNYLCNGESRPLHNSSIRNEAVIQAAQTVGTNPQYVRDAKKIRRQAPELLQPILDGLITIPQAKKIASRPIRQRVLIVAQINNGLAKNVAQAVLQIPQTEIERKEEEDLPADFGMGWVRAMHNLWIFFNSLKHHGGIAKLSRRWNRKVKQDYLSKLRKFRGAINECIEYLEKELGK